MRATLQIEVLSYKDAEEIISAAEKEGSAQDLSTTEKLNHISIIEDDDPFHYFHSERLGMIVGVR